MTTMQDLRTLFRAREIVGQMSSTGLETAIEEARTTLVTDKGRNRYLQEVLPQPIAHTVPGATDTFVVECLDEQSFHLRNGTLPLLWQIRKLEQENGTQVIKVTHRNGRGKREYWL